MENRPLVSRGLEGGKGGEAAVNIKSSVRIPVMELSCISALVVLRQTDTHMFRLHGTKHRHTNHTHTQLSLCKTGEMWIRWMSCVRANLLMVISCCSFIRRCILGLFGVSLYFFFHSCIWYTIIFKSLFRKHSCLLRVEQSNISNLI